MNTMEDKELQELFDAKRTVEANRRRQEELRQLIEARDNRRSRPLWPVWASAAAAAVALLLLTLPALFGTKESAPTLVAGTEVPEVRVTEEPGLSSTASPSSLTSPAREARKARETREAAPAARPEEEVLPEAAPMLPEPVIEEAPAIEEPVLPTETIAPTPRVMRRQSTLIACTEGCSAPEGTGETPSNSNVKVNFFSNENYADATIHTFVISK